MLDFLQDNGLSLGLVVSIVLLPLIVDRVKRRWDGQKEERERRILEFRKRQLEAQGQPLPQA